MSYCIDHGKRGNSKGYAYHSKRINGKQPRMHRLSYAVAHGLDEATMGGVVLHSCDNPRCVNPAHLSLGTNLDNVADRQSKGRQAKGSTWGGLRGELHKASKLTSENARQIRAAYAPRSATGIRALARIYNVSSSVIADVVHGRSWKEVIY